MKNRIAAWLAGIIATVALAGAAGVILADRPPEAAPTQTMAPTPTSTASATATPQPTPTQIVDPLPEWWTPEVTPVGGEGADEYVRCTASPGYRCNVRACARDDCPVVAQVWSGEAIELDAGYQGGDWWRVVGSDGEPAYAHKDWFTRVRE